MYQTIFKNKKTLIGMIHLPPLLTFAGFPGITACIEKAVADLDALERAGFDAVLIENDDDKPHTEFANEAQIASFTAIAHEVCKHARVSVGVEMMLNDWRSSIAIARAVGAQFIRLDVFVDHVTSEWGEIHPDPVKIMAYKQQIYPELVMLTDIQVKHKTMLEKKSLAESARQAIEHGTDALIVTGEVTGQETPLEKIKIVKNAFPHFPILVGAGVNEANVRDQLAIADGAIVGTSIKTKGRIDFEKASVLAQLCPSHS